MGCDYSHRITGVSNTPLTKRVRDPGKKQQQHQTQGSRVQGNLSGEAQSTEASEEHYLASINTSACQSLPVWTSTLPAVVNIPPPIACYFEKPSLILKLKVEGFLHLLFFFLSGKQNHNHKSLKEFSGYLVPPPSIPLITASV